MSTTATFDTAPTAAELISLALDRSDFLGTLDDDATLMQDNASNAISVAEDLSGYTAPPDLLRRATLALVQYGYTVLRERDQAIADALADAVEAGDLDADGEPIPYPTYRSC